MGFGGGEGTGEIGAACLGVGPREVRHSHCPPLREVSGQGWRYGSGLSGRNHPVENSTARVSRGRRGPPGFHRFPGLSTGCAQVYPQDVRSLCTVGGYPQSPGQKGFIAFLFDGGEAVDNFGGELSTG
ncbi:hypothetical protein B005_1967 [Nocardiopsis alba ATCC BAA-2165]|uniref:Uncharacterized protein n=1 Tax=Nocardiopsis alba (strain ATCC BAA-2165 / BE74) TaxID=1205910 RepID=J7L8S3_NOCAA|nr:hypothetical protein B005_1967 [Nocardiopsis alba ATCC BAA-2165]